MASPTARPAHTHEAVENALHTGMLGRCIGSDRARLINYWRQHRVITEVLVGVCAGGVLVGACAHGPSPALSPAQDRRLAVCCQTCEARRGPPLCYNMICNDVILHDDICCVGSNSRGALGSRLRGLLHLLCQLLCQLLPACGRRVRSSPDKTCRNLVPSRPW